MSPANFTTVANKVYSIFQYGWRTCISTFQATNSSPKITVAFLLHCEHLFFCFVVVSFIYCVKDVSKCHRVFLLNLFLDFFLCHMYISFYPKNAGRLRL